MTLDFPNSPTVGDEYTGTNGVTYQWDGSVWSVMTTDSDDAFITNLNTVSSNYTLSAGRNAMSAGPIEISDGVTVDINDNVVTVKGKLGELTQSFDAVSVKIDEGNVVVERPSEAKDHKAKHGLYRALINNMIEGVSQGFTKELELVGVGYRASNQGQKLDLAIGFSHNIVLEIAPEVKVETISEKGKNPIVKLTSHDKQLVGQVAAKIRAFRKPEPYKGKGIKFVGEHIRRKAGKSA